MATGFVSSKDHKSSSSGAVQLFRRLSSAGDTQRFPDELELLQNVYFDDLQISNNERELVFHVKPSTADDKEKQFVYCDVAIMVDDKYPAVIPDVSISQSRGLSDAHLESIIEGVRNLSLSNVGSPMIYDLVEYVRDCLTDNNRPCGRCPLCQYDFQDDDEFIKTECYHYFHPLCLHGYVVNHIETVNKQDKAEMKSFRSHSISSEILECPVCRVHIGDNDPCMIALQSCSLEYNIHQQDKMHFVPDASLKEWQTQMSLMYQRQLEKGGIIDLSAKDETINEVWVVTPNDAINEQQQQKICTEPGTDDKEPDNGHYSNSSHSNLSTSARDRQWKPRGEWNEKKKSYESKYGHSESQRQRPRNESKPKSEYRNESKPKSEYRNESKPRSEYRNESKPRSEYRNESKPRSEYRNESKPRSEYRNESKPRSEYRNESKPRSEYRKPRDEYRNESKPRSEYRNESKPRSEYRNESKPRNEYGNESKPRDEYRNESYKYRNETKKTSNDSSKEAVTTTK